jgi:hypothetical protein
MGCRGAEIPSIADKYLQANKKAKRDEARAE